jgi:hypothetical protein
MSPKYKASSVAGITALLIGVVIFRFTDWGETKKRKGSTLCPWSALMCRSL